MCSMEGIRFEISEVSLAELRSWYRYRYPAPDSGARRISYQDVTVAVKATGCITNANMETILQI